MQKEAAKKLIRDTLEKPFNKEQFTLFIKNLLNRLEYAPFPRPRTGQMIFADFRNHINSLDRVGKYTDSDGRKLDVLIVKLSKTTSLERARSKLRNFVAKYLKESQGGQYKEAALVAFVSPNEKDWRFSFVKMEYKFDTTKQGKPKVKEEFTPAKRYSFLVGEHENSHTAQSSLLPILGNSDNDPSLQDLENAFSIETVTKEFFEKYRGLFIEIKESLDKIVQKDKAIKADFKKKGVDTVDFSKKLLGQIVFLYFLQKKGWFGVARNEAWGTGPKNFLRLLFEGKMSSYDNFFNDVLEPLFYEALAVERQADYYSSFKCKVPFLNGGLFDPLNNYDWVHTDILIPDELFSNKIKTNEGDIGTGILDVFDRYNFTVKEDEPLEKEVAVDPEMLGKVFENLLEVKDRKSKGTYYTPREIVHYMCQESLINYLATELKDQVEREDIETLIKHGEEIIDHEQQVLRAGKETTRYPYRLSSSIRNNSELIDRKLAEIKVCDPAVGSGAFLVGMMSEIVKTRSVLARLKNPDKEPNIYGFKRDAIQDSLHGVDIDLGAVEIAKLRLWLSLIVDEDNYKHIKPLPNLDYKIMQGNSLLEEYEGIKLIDERFFEKHEEKEQVHKQLKSQQSKLQREYFELHSNNSLGLNRKTEIENSLKAIDKKLKAMDQPKPNGQEPFDIFGQTEAQSKAYKLLELHEQFFNVYHKKEKDRLHKQIDELTWDLVETTLKLNGKGNKLDDVKKFQQTGTSPFFLWKLNFADVFREGGGFDVVIGNPPYVKEDTNKKAFDGLRNSECYQGKMDLWYLFGSKGIDILKHHGIMCYIATNNWISNDGASKFRNKIITKGRFIDFVDFNNYKVFTAGIQTMVYVIAKDSLPSQYKLRYRKLLDNNADLALISDFLELGTEISTSAFTSYTVDFFRENYKDTYIKFLHPEKDKIINKINNKSAFHLSNDEVFSGIDVMQDFVNKKNASILGDKSKVGAGVFVINDKEKSERSWNEREREIIRPYYTTREINRYYANSQNKLWILYAGAQINRSIKDYPNIKDHLDQFTNIITSVNKPYGLHRTRKERIFLNDKILSIRKCARPSFSYVDFPCYVARTFLVIKSSRIDMKYLLAILNSKLIEFWLQEKGKLQGKMFQVDKVPLMAIPIMTAQQDIQSRVTGLVDNILSHVECDISSSNPANEDKVKELEKQINQLVFDIYALTSEEIAIVEGNK